MALAASVAACSKDNSNGITSTTGNSSTSTTGLTIVFDSTSIPANVAAGATLPVAIHVLQGAVPAPNVLVTWVAAAGGGSFAIPTILTDSTGLATANWVVGDTVGTNTATASIPGALVTINVLTVGGAVSTVIKVSPDSQAIVAGAALTLTARPVDRFGNGVTGVPVVWTSSGGTLSSTATTSNINGDATTNFVTDATAGVYTITASVAGKASVTFTVVGS
jgi:hypothetical protein